MGRRRVRDVGPKGRDPAAVCRGSTPLQTVVSSATEPQPDPGAAGGTPEPAVRSPFSRPRVAPAAPRALSSPHTRAPRRHPRAPSRREAAMSSPLVRALLVPALLLAPACAARSTVAPADEHAGHDMTAAPGRRAVGGRRGTPGCRPAPPRRGPAGRVAAPRRVGDGPHRPRRQRARVGGLSRAARPRRRSSSSCTRSSASPLGARRRRPARGRRLHRHRARPAHHEALPRRPRPASPPDAARPRSGTLVAADVHRQLARGGGVRDGAAGRAQRYGIVGFCWGGRARSRTPATRRRWAPPWSTTARSPAAAELTRVRRPCSACTAATTRA